MELKLNNYTHNDILENINIEIKDKIIYGIIGNGKTTLFNDLTKKNKDIKNTYKKIGYVKENIDSHFININLKEDIKLFNKINDLDLVLDILNLNKEFIGKNVFNLDYFSKKKAALFLNIINKIDILIVDEPFSNISLNEKEEIIKIFKRIKKELNIPIVIGTNDSDSLEKVSDYVYVIDKKIILEGNKYDVFKEKKILEKHDISVPKIIEFSLLVKDKKNIKLGFRDDINDLIKDIYRYAK